MVTLMTIPSSLATTMYYNIVYEGAAKNLTPAACAPLEWRRRRNGKGVAVPAIVMTAVKVSLKKLSPRCMKIRHWRHRKMQHA